MKTVKVFSAFMIAAVLIALSAPGIAMAGAYESTWASTIAYQNIGSATATVYVAFYENAGDTTPDSYPAGTIAANAGEVIIVGDLIGGTFKGSAVLSADQPLAAVIVQVAGTTTVRVRPLSNGFTGGTTATYIPTAFKLNAVGTQFSVQNVGPGQATARIRFLKGDATLQHQFDQVIEAGAAHFVDIKAISDASIPVGWQGSVEITRIAGTGMLISSAMELNTNSAAYPNKAYAFEGVGGGSLLLYMPSAQCKTGTGANITNSFYAINNPNAGDSNITVTFTWGDGTSTVKTLTVVGNGKGSVDGCMRDAGAEPTGKNGSAVIQTTNAVSFIAMGKISNANFTTAFNGIPVGYPKIALPFVRYADTTHYNTGNYQRAFITVQNISGFALAAGQATVKYYDRNGVLQATHNLDAMIDGQKRGSDPSTAGLVGFGYYDSYTASGGGVVVECTVANCKLAVVTRVTSYVTSTAQAAEDYVGIPFNP